MVYGPGDPLHRFFPILKRIDDGRRAILLEEGMAQWRGPRGYVENVAAAIALAATDDRARGRIYNVAEPQNLTEQEWTELILRAAGAEARTVVVPRPHAPPHIHLPGNTAQHWSTSSERIRAELGYREPVPLDEALARTIAWERIHPPGQIDPKKFDYDAEDAALQ
jgi:nucleoside-diphosphate-sugar epimerase